jgi:hypothetical protein
LHQRETLPRHKRRNAARDGAPVEIATFWSSTYADFSRTGVTSV